MIRIPVTCAAALLAAFPALACVTAQDLETGVAVRYGEAGGEFHRRLEGGNVEVSARQGNRLVRWTLLSGLYYARMIEIENGEVIATAGYTIDYPVRPDALPIPDGPGRWRMETKLSLLPDPPLRQSEVYTAGERQVLRLGDCRYTAIRVRVETTTEGDVTTLTVLYLPELRTSLFLNVDDTADRRPSMIVALR